MLGSFQKPAETSLFKPTIGGHGFYGGLDWEKEGQSFDDFRDPGAVLLPLLFRPLLLAARPLVARPVLHLTLSAAVPLTPASRAPTTIFITYVSTQSVLYSRRGVLAV